MGKGLDTNVTGFDRIVLFGGTSEIGLEIANQVKSLGKSLPSKKIVRVLRPSSGESSNQFNDFAWLPRSSTEVLEAVNKIGPMDLAIISIGEITLPNFSSEELSNSIEKVEANVFANGTLPTLTLLAVSQKMLRTGGGCIVLISSVAAFPVLDSNSIYAASKRMLDEIAQSMLRDLQRKGVSLLIVRPGFVPTKLHNTRTGGVLSTSSESIAKAITNRLRRGRFGVVWVPSIWRPVSWILSFFPLAKRFATTLMKRLGTTD